MNNYLYSLFIKYIRDVGSDMSSPNDIRGSTFHVAFYFGYFNNVL